MSAEDSFLNSGRRTICGVPAMLSKNDFATLKAMGAAFFDTSQVPDLGKDWSGRERDLILVAWLATRNPQEKEAAFVDPKKAAVDAFRWSAGDGYNPAESYRALIDLLADIQNAKTEIESSRGSDSLELPP